jgi:hypothetical protein
MHKSKTYIRDKRQNVKVCNLTGFIIEFYVEAASIRNLEDGIEDIS